MLVQRGADENIINNEGKTPWELIIKKIQF
jgi:hypothetical protein